MALAAKVVDIEAEKAEKRMLAGKTLGVNDAEGGKAVVIASEKCDVGSKQLQQFMALPIYPVWPYKHAL